MKKDLSITLYRVIAMLFILLCHIGTHYSQGIIAEGFKVGVQMFLLLSGYLAAKNVHKKIQINKVFSRILRLMIPIWCFVIPYMIITIFTKTESIVSFIPYILGLYGFERILGVELFSTVRGITHLWYITAALICEILTPALIMLKRKINSTSKKDASIIIVLILALHVVFGFLSDGLDYILVFATGVLLSDLIDKRFDKLSFFLYNALLVLFVGMRVVMQVMLDGTVLYMYIVNPLVYLVIALVLFLDIRFFLSLIPERVKSAVQDNIIVRFMESNSYEVYICHYVFIVGPLNVFLLAIPEFLKVILFLAASFALAFVLHCVSTVLIKKSSLLFAGNKEK